MPYVSDRQRRYFNANRAELEAQGVNVDEWNESTKGKKLPEQTKDGKPVKGAKKPKRKGTKTASLSLLMARVADYSPEPLKTSHSVTQGQESLSSILSRRMLKIGSCETETAQNAWLKQALGVIVAREERSGVINSVLNDDEMPEKQAQADSNKSLEKISREVAETEMLQPISPVRVAAKLYGFRQNIGNLPKAASRHGSKNMYKRAVNLQTSLSATGPAADSTAMLKGITTANPSAAMQQSPQLQGNPYVGAPGGVQSPAQNPINAYGPLNQSDTIGGGMFGQSNSEGGSLKLSAAHEHYNRVYDCGHEERCRCSFPGKKLVKVAGPCYDCREKKSSSNEQGSKSHGWFCETCKAKFKEDPPANKCPHCSGDPVPDIPENREKYKVSNYLGDTELWEKLAADDFRPSGFNPQIPKMEATHVTDYMRRTPLTPTKPPSAAVQALSPQKRWQPPQATRQHMQTINAVGARFPTPQLENFNMSLHGSGEMRGNYFANQGGTSTNRLLQTREYPMRGLRELRQYQGRDVGENILPHLNREVPGAYQSDNALELLRQRQGGAAGMPKIHQGGGPNMDPRTGELNWPKDAQKPWKDVRYMGLSPAAVLNHELSHAAQPEAVTPRILAAMKAKGPAKYDEYYAHNSYQDVPENPDQAWRDRAKFLTQFNREVPPSLGDIAFGSEEFRRDNNFVPPIPVPFGAFRPQDYDNNKLPTDYPYASPDAPEEPYVPKLDWFNDQAREHGYFDGKSMEELLSTPEGQQWLEMVIRRSNPPAGQYKKGAWEKLVGDQLTKQAQLPRVSSVPSQRDVLQSRINAKNGYKPPSKPPLNIGISRGGYGGPHRAAGSGSYPSYTPKITRPQPKPTRYNQYGSSRSPTAPRGGVPPLNSPSTPQQRIESRLQPTRPSVYSRSSRFGTTTPSRNPYMPRTTPVRPTPQPRPQPQPQQRTTPVPQRTTPVRPTPQPKPQQPTQGIRPVDNPLGIAGVPDTFKLNPLTDVDVKPNLYKNIGNLLPMQTRHANPDLEKKMFRAGEAMHSDMAAPGTTRGDMMNAIRQQGGPPRWENPVGERMVRDRFSFDQLNNAVEDMPIGYDKKPDEAHSLTGGGRVYMPQEPPNNIGQLTHGYPGILNHEMEHAYQQSAATPDDLTNDETVDYLRNRPHVLEFAPGVGDTVFAGEQFRQQHGKHLGPSNTIFDPTEKDPPPPQYQNYQVNLPGRTNAEARMARGSNDVGAALSSLLTNKGQNPGKQHDIRWMIEQAKQHGYFDGRSMTDLIFNTPEGQQWYSQMTGIPTPKYEPPPRMEKNNVAKAFAERLAK